MQNNKHLILAIETSCDETSAAVYDAKKGLFSNVVASQIDIHKKTGGVVPEVASRAHVEQIIPVIDEALERSGVKLEEIDYIAVTHAPGLIGSLLVGVNTAKTLSAVLDKPILPINHLEGHIYANFIKKNHESRIMNHEFKFPAVVLLVSGGHTSLILMKDHGRYKYLGETLDDAAGEAFDKVAKILGLEYPGGPNVSKFAEEYRKKYPISNIQYPINNQSLNNQLGSGRFFPRSMLNSKDFNFSFSGLKTSVLYKWQDIIKNIRKNSSQFVKIRETIAYEFEEAVVDILATKTIEAAQKYKVKTISICGGVAANKMLREEIENRVKRELKKVSFCVPPIEYCGDNAAMIACCAAHHLNIKPFKQINKKTDLSFEVLSNKEL
uniref:tRNA N6-adenosine threonylcarbamoyltransferase n=1 Tax=candidate division CPR3 bacterium TaxID=2268181 RepID=A0A7C4M396_UNCC3